MHEQVIVGEAIAGRSATVRRDLKKLVSSLHVNEFDLAELLYEADEGNYYAGWGYSSRAEYAAQELGLKERKAQYLAKIVRVCKAVGLKRENYEPAGKSKLREISVLDPEKSFWDNDKKVSEPLSDHIVRLILDHDKLTVEQTRDEVLRLQGRTGPDRPVHRTTTYPLSVWENVIKAAMEKARKIMGSQERDTEGNAVEYSDGACMEVICADFLADPTFDEPELTEEEEPVTIKIPTEGD
jgi:hypothetical protein